MRKHPGESSEQEEARIRRQYDEILYMYKQIESLTEEKEEICEKLFLMQENFIRKLDQQIEKTEEDPQVLEKLREEQQREQEEGFDGLGAVAPAGMKTKQKSKAGRAVTSGAYFGKDVGYDVMSSYGFDKVSRPSGTGLDLRNFDSDVLGKLE